LPRQFLPQPDGGSGRAAACAGFVGSLGYVAPLTIETIESNGYSAEGLTSKPIMHSHWQEVDLVINMSGFDKNRVFEEPEKVEDWPVEDPFGADAETYQQTFDEIRTRIVELAARKSLEQIYKRQSEG